jgi:hypothetical protein
MKRFLLLRDNQESGPYTLEELQLLGLKWSDLIWVEGESISWNYPANLEVFKELTGGFPAEATSGYGTLTPTDSLPNRSETFPSQHSEEADLNNRVSDPQHSKAEVTTSRSGNNFFTSNGVWLVALVTMLAATTWLMIEAVDVFTGKGLTKSKMTHVVAPLKILPEGAAPIKEEDGTIQNAISREIVPVDTTEMKEPVKKKPRLKELRKYLQVESSKYKVGVFGGINDLQLTVVNNSAYELDKVVVQVDYLKPKGEPVETEKYTYFSIPAHGKKTLEIPPTKRGIKVKYRIVDAKSREYKVALVQA